MKKILFLLLSTVAMYGQVPADATPLENIQITNNTTDNSATKVNVQSTDGTINTISKSDLVNVVEVNDVPSLPLVGEAGKIYVVKNVNKIYRWNGTFYQELAGSDISGLQAQIDLKANNSDVVKLTGNQTISGQKSFSLTGKIDMQTNNAFPAIRVTALGSNGESAAEFINNSSSPYSTALRLQTSSSGGVGNTALNVSNQSPIGTGIVSNAISSGGVSISSQSGNGDSYISNITLGGTGRNYVGRNNGTETYSVDKIGNVIGNSYIKRSTPANNILLAGGGDIAQNTAFNKNFGTTAGTVVEGGTLGSNAYSSTAYQPLLTNPVTGTGTTNYIPKFTASGTVGNSSIFDNGTNVGIGTNNPNTKLTIEQSNNNASVLIRNGVTASHNTLYMGNDSVNNSSFLGSYKGDDSNFSTLILQKFGGNTILGNPTDNGVDKLQVNGSATFSSTVTATSFNGSATLTGTPTAPTAIAGTNTTQIATTAFVASADSGNVKLTGDQNISGLKTFTNSSNSRGIHSYNTSTGDGIYSENIAGGVGLHLNNFSGGNNIVSNNSATGTGFNYVGQNQDINTFTVDKTGITTSTQYRISALNTAPASATATGTTGEIRITSGFIYICIATNTWVRAALTTWI